LRLRTRLVALVALAALPPLGIQAWTDVKLMQSQRAALEAQLLAEARFVAAEQARAVEQGRQLVAALATSPAVRIPDTDRCTRLLSELAAGFAEFRVLAVADRAGRITCASVTIPVPAPNVAERAWFRKVMNENTPAVGEPTRGALASQMQLPVAHPLRGPDQRPFGAIFATLDLDSVSARLARSAQSMRSVLVADLAGRVVAVANLPGVAPGDAVPPSLAPFARSFNPGVVQTGPTGDVVAVLPASNESSGLWVVVSAPAAEFLAPIQATGLRAQLALGGVALLALLVGLVGARFVLERPLARLSAAMRAWRGGEYGARANLSGRDEIADLGRTFDTMAEAVASRDAALHRAAENKARLLAAAAHDQRHRLQILQLLQDRVAELPQHAIDRRIVNAADASLRDLERSIGQLLSASALETGMGPKPAPRAVAAQELLDAAGQAVRLKAEAKDIRLRVSPTKLWVRTDPDMMATILLNLAENAVKYTDQGGVLLAARWRRDGVRLSVVDTGIGIASADRHRIFEEFNRLNPNREGLGLGLSIVRRLADQLGHTVAVDGVPGRGSAFYVEVPRA
jgi:signal transduction histidine kinase